MTMRGGRRRSSAPRRRGPRRKALWQGVSIAFNSIADNANALSAVLDVRSSPALIGSTIVRIHGEFGARQITSANLSNAATVTGGLLVVQGEAFDAGAASVPEPFGDADARWMWHKDMIMQGTGADDGGQVSVSLVDVRSKRKMGANDVLVAVVANRANASADLVLIIRFLLLLP